MRNCLSGTVLLALACISCGEVREIGQDGGGIVDGASTVDASLIDAPTGDIDSGGPCPLGAICSGPVNFAFVTSESYVAQDVRTAAAADSICNELAMDGNLPGTYVAWLSTDTESARSRLGTANGWVRPDRRPFAVSQSSLLDFHEIVHPLNMDENKVYSADDAPPVMTGSTADGDTAAVCPELSGSGGSVRVGLSDRADGRWSFSESKPCADRFRMYCFGVDNDSPLTNLPVAVGRKAWVSNRLLSSDARRNGMDGACAGEAIVAGVTGPVIALVAQANESAVSRLNTNGPTWVRTDGVVLWEQAGDILTAPPLAGISVLATGVSAPEDIGFATAGAVWSGARSPNVAGEGTHCFNWDTTVATGASIGDMASVGPSYFFNSAVPCAALLPVYCFER